VEEIRRELESVLLLNMEGNHAWDGTIQRYLVTSNLVLLMESGPPGLVGVNAQWTVEEEVRRELASVVLLNMEGKHVMAPVVIRQHVTLNPALLMESGQAGLNGLHAQ